MNPPIQEHAATVRFQMAPVTRYTIGSLNTGFDVEDLSDFSVLVQIFDHLKITVPTAILMDHKYAALFLCGIHYFRQLFAGQCHGLFTNDMFSCLQRLDSDLFVHIIRRCNQYGICTSIIQSFFQASIGAIPICFASLLPTFQNIEYPMHFYFRICLNQLSVKAAHASVTNDRDF